MKITRHLAAAWGMAFALATPIAAAAPGAHGPNGEHLDAPSASAGGAPVPRIEAQSEAFELVGQLQGGELSILVNRFETNEPVLGAGVEVESGNLKAKAQFHPDHGDYAVADEAFVKAVSKPGAHPLVITITAGGEADLLEGTLKVPDAAHDHDHGPAVWPRWLAAGLAVLFIGALAWRVLRRRRNRSLAVPGSAA